MKLSMVQGFKGSRKGNSLKISILLLTTSYFLLCIGCGYKFQGRDTLPFSTVKIGRIENKTFEPKLEDKFQRFLAEELVRNGFKISDDAKHVISGGINRFELKTLAEKKNVGVEFEVLIKGSFILTFPDGKTTELRNSGKFIVSFYSEGKLEELMISKEGAIDSALRSLASEIAAGIIYSQ